MIVVHTYWWIHRYSWTCSTLCMLEKCAHGSDSKWLTASTGCLHPLSDSLLSPRHSLRQRMKSQERLVYNFMVITVHKVDGLYIIIIILLHTHRVNSVHTSPLRWSSPRTATGTHIPGNNEMYQHLHWVKITIIQSMITSTLVHVL